MTFTLTIDCDNAAFHEVGYRDEIARILRDTVRKLDNGRDGGTLTDLNGNNVGTFGTTDEVSA